MPSPFVSRSKSIIQVRYTHENSQKQYAQDADPSIFFLIKTNCEMYADILCEIQDPWPWSFHIKRRQLSSGQVTTVINRFTNGSNLLQLPLPWRQRYS